MSVGGEIANGVFWGAIQKYSGIVVQLIITAVLARLLSPGDFGVIAVATVWINFFTLFTDVGIGPAIIQSRDLTTADLNSIFSFCILIGLFLALLFFGMSRLTASYFQNESLVLICRILSVNLFFAACNIVPNALVNKNKRFRFIAERTLGLQVAGGGIAMMAAFHGLGVYSLLIAPVCTAAGVFVLNYRQYPLKFRFRIDVRSLRKIFSYSVYQFLFNFINYFSRNMDKLIIGRYFSMTELGYYEKSYRLMMFPMNNITHVVTPVMHPVLTSFQNDHKELADKYGKIVRLLASVSFPLGVFCYFAASDIISIVYGDKWEAAVPVFEILSLSLPLQMLLSTTGSVFQSSGNTRWMFYSGLSNSFCTVAGFVFSALYFRTLEAMAWAWTLTLSVNTVVSYTILYKAVLHRSAAGMIGSCIVPLVGSLILTFILMVFRGILGTLPHTASFLSILALASVFAFGIARFVCRRELNRLWKYCLDKFIRK